MSNTRYDNLTEEVCCRVLKTAAASPVYHLDGGVYGWYRAFGDEGFTGRAVNLGRAAYAL